MLLGFLALLLLVAAFVVVRKGWLEDGGGAKRLDTLWSAVPSWRTSAVGIAVVIVGNTPLALVAAPFSGFAPHGAGDGRTHAMMARALARGVPHGWTDVYQGGFPIGPHYPSIGWALSALLIKIGIPAQTAVEIIGLVATLAAPILVFIVAHRTVRAGLFPSLLGALFLSWVSPTNPFAGGYEAFFTFGLLSQVVAIPCVVALIAGVARAQVREARGGEGGTAPWRATLPAVLAMAAHPQITTACIGALLLPVLAARDKALIARYARATAAAVFVGVAIYGPGVATLRVPFGWPPMPLWKTVGFESSRLFAWLLDGELLDAERSTPVLGTLWGVAMIIVVGRITRPAARAVVIASLVTLVLSVSGDRLRELGSVGVFLLTFFQPLRMLAIVPLAATATVIVAMEEATPYARVLCARLLARPAALWGLAAAILIGFSATALPARLEWARVSRATLATYNTPSAPCGRATPNGFDQAAVVAWLGSLSEGRLWYEQESKPGPGRSDTTATQACDFATGFDLASSVPVAVTIGIGGHVGVHMVAFHRLDPGRAGSASRAEALGVRHLLLLDGTPAGAADPGWEMNNRSGDVTLERRQGGTNIVGVGCVNTIWTGSDKALRDRLLSDLKTNEGVDRLLDPKSLIALETTGAGSADTGDTGGVIERAAPPSDCNVMGAEVREVAREPGAYEAEIETATPVDVVFRAAAFPTWRVLVDGNLVQKTTTIAPGFVSTRLPPGKHHVEAVVSTLPGYFSGIVVALLAAMLCSLPVASLASVVHRLRRRSTKPTDAP